MSKSKLIILGIAIMSVVMVSCHKGRNKLVNSWKVTEVEAKTSTSDSLRNAILANGKLTFTEDGYVSGYLGREIEKGTFILSDGGKHLVLKDETGTPWSFESAVTNDQLVLDGAEFKITLDKN